MAYLSDTHRQSAEYTTTYLTTLFNYALSQAKTMDSSYARLWRVIRDVGLAGGKRLRPYLTTLGYQLGPDHTEIDITPVAAAQELLHIAILMHDDVIDRDTIRHGTLNVSGRYEEIYTSVTPSNRSHFADGAAIVAGDLLISEAYKAIIDSDFSSSDKRHVIDILHRSIFEVVGGELMDVEATFMKDGSYNSLTIARHKTAIYTVAGPLLSGARLAHAAEDVIACLDKYATNLGIAFQIQDDLLGVFGNETVTGKTSLGDIREGKQTYLIEQYIASLSSSELASFSSIFGNPHASLDDIESLKTAIKASSAYENTLHAIDSYALAAKTALDSIEDSAVKQELVTLIERLSRRTY